MRGLAVMNDDAAEEEEEEGEGEGVNDPRTNRKPNAFKDNISDAPPSERVASTRSCSRSSPFIRVIYKTYNIGWRWPDGRRAAGGNNPEWRDCTYAR